jgi:hypothetical protein
MESVEGAEDASPAPVEDVGVDHGDGDVAVAEELLDGADVVAGFEEVGGEGVPEAVGGDVLGDPGEGRAQLDGSLDDGLVEVVAAGLSGAGVKVGAGRGEEPLPGPRAGGVRVLEVESVGELDVSRSVAEVGLVLGVDLAQVRAELGDETRREGGDAVPSAFAVSEEDLAAVEVEVLDSKGGALEEAKSRSIEERGDEARSSVHLVEERGDLFGREHDGEAVRALRASEVA